MATRKKKQVREDAIRLRAFVLRMERNPTAVDVTEFSDGTFGIALITERLDMPSVITTFRVNTDTFRLLSEALFRAAHDPTVWRPIPETLKDPAP